MSENIDDTIKRLDECYAYVNLERQVPGDPFWMVANTEIVNAYPALRDHIGELTAKVAERDAEIARLRRIEGRYLNARMAYQRYDETTSRAEAECMLSELGRLLAGEGGG